MYQEFGKIGLLAYVRENVFMVINIIAITSYEVDKYVKTYLVKKEYS